jgi:23S rRNA (uracil1939-C5)-methyltransferase
MELDIIGMTLDGDGVAEAEGRVIAVAGTIPGERVEARLVRARDGCPPAEVVRIVAASPHRVTPKCGHFGPCGGCAWQHIAYAEQLRLKQQMLQELLPGLEVRPTLPTPSAQGSSPVPLQATSAQRFSLVQAPWQYRNKVSFVFGPGGRGQTLVMGHYRRGSRTIVPVRECPVHADVGNRFAFAVQDVLARARIPGATPDGDDGVARHVVARVAEGTGELLGTLVVTENVKALRRVTTEVQKAIAPGRGEVRPPRAGFHLNIHDRPGSMLFGRETRRLFGIADIREQVGGVSYVVSPTAFFQTNVRAAEVMVREVLDALADARFGRVLDLYAGVGLFALPLAMRGRSVTAIEENRHAMASAASALRLNRIPEQACRLVAARVEDTGRVGAGAWDAVILDPPRQGCPPAVLDWILRTLRPPRIVYVSCNPEALARDLATVPGSGYRLERIQPIDMFPHTAHIETVVVMDRDRSL